MSRLDLSRLDMAPLARLARLGREGALSLARGSAAAARPTRAMLADRARIRAEGRLLVLGVAFFAAFATIGGRMAVLASSEPVEPESGGSIAEPILSTRADITDRDGRLLATNLDTASIYAQPRQMMDPAQAARSLAAIFPDLDEERLLRDFTGTRSFVWIRRQASPEQMQQVHDIGDPGLLFGPRQMRLYPNGPIAAHILGGAGYGREDVAAAEVIGVAGVERYFDDRLRDPQAEPLALSIDLTVQAAMEEVLAGGMTLMNARGAAGILLDVRTGEIVAMASLPDFDPNTRPPVPTGEGVDASDSPLFNRAIQGVYELGSVFKIFAVSQALELGLIQPDTVIETDGPVRLNGVRVADIRNLGPSLPVFDVIAKSSNVGTARIISMVGPERQRAFLDRLGLTRAPSLEMPEARMGRPLVPERWSEVSMTTIAFGYGVATPPINLARAYAAIANDGVEMPLTLLRRDAPVEGERVLGAEVAAEAQAMLRRVVTDGSASFIDLATYQVAGKTGTANKPRPSGGYFDDRTIATFAGFFPYDDPRYVIVVSLDEPVETSGAEPRRTAGWTAVPIAAEIVTRVGPLLGLRPQVAAPPVADVTLTSN